MNSSSSSVPESASSAFPLPEFRFEIPNLDATEALGRALGPLLFPGAVLALIGPLGVGKTHFTRAVAEGLEVRNPNVVTSPTFVLIQEYTARLPMYHFDAYRLPGEREFAELGADEYLYGEGVCLVEWADKVPAALPTELLEIRIEIVDRDRRRMVVSPRGRRYEELARDWWIAAAPLTCSTS